MFFSLFIVICNEQSNCAITSTSSPTLAFTDQMRCLVIGKFSGGKSFFPDGESNPGRRGESAES